MTAEFKATKRARLLTDDQLQRAIAVAARSRFPESGVLKLLLSFYAGLRAGEIATLTVDAVCDAGGNVGRTIEIAAELSKSRKSRSIPMHPLIKDAIQRFRWRYPEDRFFAIGRGPERRQSANAVTIWFKNVYKEAGLTGCSSHSGRRSFITNLARRANEFHNSLHDVQRLAGHQHLQTTEMYIEPSDDVEAMVFSLGSMPSRRRNSRLIR